MKISIITAMTRHGVIGQENNRLPWRIREELAYFKQNTLHKVVIMGSNTFASLNNKPLINRFNIVLTKHPDRFAIDLPKNPVNVLLPQHSAQFAANDLQPAFLANPSCINNIANLQLSNNFTNLAFATNVEDSLRLAHNFYQLSGSCPSSSGLSDHASIVNHGSGLSDNASRFKHGSGLSDNASRSKHSSGLGDNRSIPYHGATLAASHLQASNFKCADELNHTGDDPAISPEIMVIGGREVYKQFLPIATKLYISIIKHDYSGEVFFPIYDKSLWHKIFSQEYPEFIAEIWELSK